MSAPLIPSNEEEPAVNAAAQEAKPSQRYRITFATTGPLAYASVLDLGTVWERSLRRAGIALRYSQGFNPRPKMQFASPLPTGCGGAAEWLDIWLESPMEPAQIAAALKGKTPDALSVLDVTSVPENELPLSEQLVATETLALLQDANLEAVQTAIAELLDTPVLLRPRRGKQRGKSYDLRPLIESLTAEAAPPPWSVRLSMRLTARPGATGRPDEVLDALGLADKPQRCTRTKLILGYSAEENHETHEK